MENLVDLDGNVLAQFVLGGVDEFLVGHDGHVDVAHEDEPAADRGGDALRLELPAGEQLHHRVRDRHLGGYGDDAKFGDGEPAAGFRKLDSLDGGGADIQSDEMTGCHVKRP